MFSSVRRSLVSSSSALFRLRRSAYRALRDEEGSGAPPIPASTISASLPRCGVGLFLFCRMYSYDASQDALSDEDADTSDPEDDEDALTEEDADTSDLEDDDSQKFAVFEGDVFEGNVFADMTELETYGDAVPVSANKVFMPPSIRYHLSFDNTQTAPPSEPPQPASDSEPAPPFQPKFWVGDGDPLTPDDLRGIRERFEEVSAAMREIARAPPRYRRRRIREQGLFE